MAASSLVAFNCELTASVRIGTNGGYDQLLRVLYGTYDSQLPALRATEALVELNQHYVAG
jgi:hypothetical protein